MANRVDAKRLDEAMRVAGIDSDAELARRVGLGRAAPGKWRRGATTPAGDTLVRLCEVLNVSPGYLFGATEGASDALDAAIANVRPEQRDKVAEAVRLALKMMGVPAAPEPPRRARRSASHSAR